MDNLQVIDISTLYDSSVAPGERLQVKYIRKNIVKRLIAAGIGLCVFIPALFDCISRNALTGIIFSSMMIAWILFKVVSFFIPKKPAMVVEHAGITIENRLYRWKDIDSVIYDKDADEGYDELVFNFKNNERVYFPLYLSYDRSLITIANYILKYYKNVEVHH